MNNILNLLIFHLIYIYYKIQSLINIYDCFEKYNIKLAKCQF